MGIEFMMIRILLAYPQFIAVFIPVHTFRLRDVMLLEGKSGILLFYYVNARTLLAIAVMKPAGG